MLNALHDLLAREWTPFLIFFLAVTVVMGLRQILAGLFYWLARSGRIRDWPLEPRRATVFLTIYRENERVLERSLRSLVASLDKCAEDYAILAMVDGYGDDDGEGDRCAAIARKYTDHVFVTNARSKRRNLANLMQVATREGLLHEFSLFMDSDTVLEDDDVVMELLKPFADRRIGGVTTAQRALDPQTTPERIGDWLEHARLYSSMPAGSLFFGQVGCLPGRLYAVRTRIVRHRMGDLVDDWWRRWFFFGPRIRCYAGDDRVITNFVLRARNEAGERYRTVLAPRARVRTLVASDYRTMFLTWRRWGCSSQGYTLRGLHWLWQRPFVLFQYLTDIAITLGVIFFVFVHWPLSLWVGRSEIVFWEAMMLSLGGMCLTVLFRQAPHLFRQPRDLLLIPWFVACMTLGHVVRFAALLNPGYISVWGSRRDADDAGERETWWMREWRPAGLRPSAAYSSDALAAAAGLAKRR